MIYISTAWIGSIHFKRLINCASQWHITGLFRTTLKFAITHIELPHPVSTHHLLKHPTNLVPIQEKRRKT